MFAGFNSRMLWSTLSNEVSMTIIECYWYKVKTIKYYECPTVNNGIPTHIQDPYKKHHQRQSVRVITD